MTQRSGFVLRVKPDRIDEYVEAHRDVWPEMLDALRGAGIRNYTIFRAGNEMFGYFEADDLAARAERYLAAQEVCARWQDAMAEFLDERVPTAGRRRWKRSFGSTEHLPGTAWSANPLDSAQDHDRARDVRARERGQPPQRWPRLRQSRRRARPSLGAWTSVFDGRDRTPGARPFLHPNCRLLERRSS